MLFLGRKPIIAQEEELGPEQADSFGSAPDSFLDVLYGTGIAKDFNPVSQDGLFHLFRDFVPCGQPVLEFFSLTICRIDNNFRNV